MKLNSNSWFPKKLSFLIEANEPVNDSIDAVVDELESPERIPANKFSLCVLLLDWMKEIEDAEINFSEA
jgi:hypothetical protein